MTMPRTPLVAASAAMLTLLCAGESAANRAVATVAGSPIVEAQVQRRVLELSRQVSFHGRLSDEMQRKLRDQALAQLIEEELLLAEARRLKLVPSDEGVAITRAQLVAQAGGPQKFSAKLARAQQTWAEHWVLLRRHLALRAVSERLLGNKAQVSDAEARRYYQAHAARYTSPPEVQLRQMVFSVQPADPATAWDSALAKARAAAARLSKGEAFDKVAVSAAGQLPVGHADFAHRRASAAPAQGWVKKGQLVPELEQVAFRLKTGEHSPPIKVLAGYAVIKVEGQRVGGALSYAQVAPTIKQLIAEQRLATVRADLFAELRKRYAVNTAGASRPARDQ